MELYPRHHAAEGTTRLAVSIDVLFLSIEIGVIDAGSSCDQYINISRYRCKSSVCSMAECVISFMSRTLLYKKRIKDSRFCVSQFTNISEKKWRVKVTLNIGLLEGLNFAGKNVFDVQANLVLFEYRLLNKLQSKKRRLGPRTHRSDA